MITKKNIKNIVVMPNFKEINLVDNDFIVNCKNSWKNWCNKNDIDFYEITTSIASFESIPPQIQKMWVLDILLENKIEFNQIAQVDYDTFILPHCPNFFEKTNNNFSAVLDNGFGPTINRSIQMVKNNWYKNINVNWDTYFNSGFIVYNKNHLNVFKEIQNFYFLQKDNWCIINKSPNLTDDQTLLNFEIRKQNYKVTFLDRSYNVLDWHCKNFFANYTDELGRDIISVKSIKDCVNIFHLTGDLNFRNQASNFLITNFY